ncbi:MAG: glycosyl transferase [Spirulinaceae cyanobacterium SM2_1_0]|nr:glycosyl transferase [Spirulinaceae cyanobacterium SM2_1_0]
MTRSAIYFAITAHGFGHAVRAASVAEAIRQLAPDIQLFLVTAAPRWLLDAYIQGDYIHRPRALDVGVIQADSLNMDQAATLAQLRQLRDRQQALIASEADFIRTNRISLILADIPPLAAPIAAAAGVPCWMMSNFGWDFIYRDWGGEFVEAADWISECYGQCDRLFRLPLHESMSAFPQCEDVGLTGGKPNFTPEHLRSVFHLTAARDRTVLLSFGGLGLQKIPYNKVADFPDWLFLSFDRNAPELPNLRRIEDRRYRPVDFMPLCDRIVSKPGYSTFSEALRLGLPITSLTRSGFAESPLLLTGIQNYAAHQLIEPDAFFAGDWDFLLQAPTPPRQSTRLPADGTESIARTTAAFLQASR